LIVTVPDDAVLVLAATICCDGDFACEFDSVAISYRLSIDELPPAIGAIHLRIQNALTSKRLGVRQSRMRMPNSIAVPLIVMSLSPRLELTATHKSISMGLISIRD
jgi:hypothetical protein